MSELTPKERMKLAQKVLAKEEARRRVIAKKVLEAHGWIVSGSLVSEILAVIEDFEEAIKNE